MKKFLFLSVLMLTVLSVKFSLKEPKASSLLLDNVEALAADESNLTHYCIGRGSVDCPISKVKVEMVYSGYSFDE